MRIAVCGSIAFIDDIVRLKERLESLGHQVQMPLTAVTGPDGNAMPSSEYYALRKGTLQASGGLDEWIVARKEAAIRTHFEKITAADAVLIANYGKNGIDHYVGANTLLEMGVAFYLRKRIFLLNPVPKMEHGEEILAMRPQVLDGDLTRIS